MSQALITQQPKGLRELLSSAEVQQGLSSALGNWMNPDTFLAQMLIACSDPKYDKCTLASKYKAVHLCATLGLLPTYQQVALIARKVKDSDSYEMTVMPQWQGFKALLERHTTVLEVSAILVLQKDHIEYLGDGLDMIPVNHRFNPLEHTANDVEELQGGYARVLYRDNREPKFHFVSADYIAKARACSESYKGRERALKDKKSWVPACPWTDGWFEQMSLKTVLRSLYSRRVVPVDPMVAGRVEAFLRHEDALLGNDPRILDTTAVAALPAPSGSRSSYLAQQLTKRPETVPASIVPAPGPQPVIAEGVAVPPTQGPDVEQTAELAAGELPADYEEPNNDQPQDLYGQFLDMLAQCKNRSEVEKLRLHFLENVNISPDLSREERDEIAKGCETRLKDFPAPSGPPKPAKQKTLT